jgi:hypothetical protein
MSRDKKSKVDDITKLRKILDKPSDPETKKMISEDEKALNSIQKRLAGETTKTPVKSEIFLRKYDTLEPKVTIRAKTPLPPEPTTPLPIFQPVPVQTIEPIRTQPVTTTLPEFELISTPAPLKSTPSLEVLFANEALYEIEKIEPAVPEFYEVTPSEIPQKTQETKTTMNPDEQPIQRHDLPEWQPLEKEESKEPQEKQQATTTVEFQQIEPEIDSTHDEPSTDDIIPEFEPIETPPPQRVEKPDDWTILPPKKQSKETPIELPVVNPLETPNIKLIKKQERETKKAEKRKEKEAKKQKKLELKKLKKETREKEREAQRLAQEQHSIQQPEPQPVQPEPIAEEKPLKMKIDITAFKGMETIDEKTAELLYKNGYFSIANLKEATIDDLVQIRGIKRKHAKQIKKEVQEKTTTSPEPEFVPLKGKARTAQLKETLDDITEWESYRVENVSEKLVPLDVCTYEDYILYKQTTSSKGRGGKKTTIHFFSKEKPAGSIPAKLPDGYQVAVNKKTKVPYLKKKK